MIIVQLMGGLGNQLFQYALGRSLSTKLSVPLKLDAFSFQKDTLRQYKLDKFNTRAEISSKAEIDEVLGTDNHPRSKLLLKFFHKVSPYYKRSYVKERHFHFDPNILTVPSKVYLAGYWQSEKYFKEISTILRKELSLKEPLHGANAKLLKLIQSTNSVSIHVRRGDYLKLSYTQPCTQVYYHNAVEYIESLVNPDCFYIFSDDLAWAKENLAFIKPAVFMNSDGCTDDCDDMYLLSQCKHHIIANSTFSWWGGWLSPYSEKKIVAPQHWFANSSKNTKDLIPASWHTI